MYDSSTYSRSYNGIIIDKVVEKEGFVPGFWE